MSTQQNSKNLNKKIPPVFILLTSLFLFILSRLIFSDISYRSSLAWALLDVSALLFFLLGIASSISNHFSRKKEAKNNLSTENKDSKTSSAPKIKKRYYLLIFLVVILIPVIYVILNNNKKEEVIIPKGENNIISVTETKEVQAYVFYDGKYGYSVSIPSGNSSTCIWTYEAGSGGIPYKEITEARTATEKHTLSLFGGEEDLKVICVDDFGNNYKVIIPEQYETN